MILPESRSVSHDPLPDSWIGRIFDHMSGLYGSKFSDLWRGSDLGTVRRIWAEKLAGFASMPKAIKEALDALDDKPFPPTLPEFLALCREAGRRHGGNKPAIEYKPTAEEKERAEIAAKEIKKIVAKDDRDYMAWAKFPVSRLAFESVKKMAETDYHFREILKAHVADGVCTEEFKMLKVWENKQWVTL